MEYKLRDATLNDAPALARLHVRTFRETHGGGPTESFREGQWKSWLGEPVANSFCVVLESPATELIGFARGIPHLDEGYNDFGGELNKIYLLREYHRQGFGRRLLCACAQRFVQRGITSMLLFGDAASPSNVFYEAMGAERLCAAGGEFHGGYGWRDLRALIEKCAPHVDFTISRSS
jgi:GNAT superfamily N-acetyltransferase